MGWVWGGDGCCGGGGGGGARCRRDVSEREVMVLVRPELGLPVRRAPPRVCCCTLVRDDGTCFRVGGTIRRVCVREGV